MLVQMLLLLLMLLHLLWLYAAVLRLKWCRDDEQVLCCSRLWCLQLWCLQLCCSSWLAVPARHSRLLLRLACSPAACCSL